MTIPCGMKRVGILNMMLYVYVQGRTLCISLVECYELVIDSARKNNMKLTYCTWVLIDP